MPSLYLVVRPYRRAYNDPLRLAAGDEVTVLPRADEEPGWLWCRDKDGKTGWVPDEFLSRGDGAVRLACDYDATELSVEVGETFRPVRELAGWIWGTDDRGNTGWVPRNCLDFVKQ